MSNGLKNKQKIIIIVALLAAVSILSVLITSQFFLSKTTVKKNQFVGTYSIHNSNNTTIDDEYIVIPEDKTTNTMVYDTYGKCSIKGYSKLTNRNYATLYNEKDKIVATLMYSYKKYYFIQNGKETISVTKISDTPILP